MFCEAKSAKNTGKSIKSRPNAGAAQAKYAVRRPKSPSCVVEFRENQSEMASSAKRSESKNCDSVIPNPMQIA